MKKIFLSLVLLFIPGTVLAADLKLDKLTIEGQDIVLKENIYNYDVTIGNDCSKASIIFPKNEKISYEIIGNDNLKIGRNEVIIALASQDKIQEYKLNLLKLSDNVVELSNNNKLKNLSIRGYAIGFSADKQSYNLTIKSEASLNISYETESKQASVYVDGNENLINGSVIKIKVVAQSGDIREYQLKINATEVREKEEIINNNQFDVKLAFYIGAAILISLFVIIINVNGNKKSKIVKK
ncbi:MAG: hypothetical protein RR404_02315 [Bacilli bacterium]